MGVERALVQTGEHFRPGMDPNQAESVEVLLPCVPATQSVRLGTGQTQVSAGTEGQSILTVWECLAAPYSDIRHFDVLRIGGVGYRVMAVLPATDRRGHEVVRELRLVELSRQDAGSLP